MSKQTKLLVFGGLGLALITFIGFKIFSKPKAAPLRRPDPKRGTGLLFEEEIIPEIETTDVYAVITRDGTRLRAEPSTNSEILNTYSKGVTLYVFDSITKDDGLWYNVDDGEFVSGWVRSDVVDKQ